MKLALRPSLVVASLVLWSAPAPWPAPAAATSAADLALRRTPVVQAVARVAPAVVRIAADRLHRSLAEPADAIDPLIEEPVRMETGPAAGDASDVSLGSGLVVDPGGLVVTNEHVVRRGAGLKVILADGRELPASVRGVDSASDLALLEVKAGGPLPHAPLGDSSDLMAGETLIAIGHPMGLGHSVSVGVLSAVGRRVRAGSRTFADFLQTDASIHPGNSGGPVVDLAGRVVGVATAIHAEAGGIGFAIPATRARQVVAALAVRGLGPAPWIGMRTQPAGPDLRAAHPAAARGALVVTSVVGGGPAAMAGIRAGDLVVGIGGRAPAASSDLDAALGGDRRVLELEVSRDGELRRVEVRPIPAASPRVDRIVAEILGLSLQAVNDGDGVVVGEVREGSLAGERGFRRGDRIRQVEGEPMAGIESFRVAFLEALDRDGALVLVERAGATFYVPLALDP